MKSFSEFLEDDKPEDDKPEETLIAYIEKHGGDFFDWYCGITKSPKKRLKQHELENNIKIKLHTSVKCGSQIKAIILEKKMQKKGCEGYKPSGPGGVKGNSKHVYVFKKK